MSLDELVHHMAGIATPTRRTGAVAKTVSGTKRRRASCDPALADPSPLVGGGAEQNSVPLIFESEALKALGAV